MKKSTRPYFSVVVPVYNKGPHIYRALQSVLDQTCSDFEIVIVNDASTDNSMEEVNAFEDPRIRLFERSRSGPGGYAARNLGIEKANAEWIAFLDADDEWNPDHLENYKELIRTFPEAQVLGCGREIVQPGGAIRTGDYFKIHAADGSHYLTLDGYLEAYISGLRPLWTSVTCIRKQVLQQAGGFPAGRARRGGDIDTWLRCVEYAGGMAWSAHIGARYFKDSVNMVTNNTVNTAEVERATVKVLLKRHSGKTAVLLKKFANNRTMKAFKEHRKVKGRTKLSYLTRLYFSALPFNKISGKLGLNRKNRTDRKEQTGNKSHA